MVLWSGHFVISTDTLNGQKSTTYGYCKLAYVVFKGDIITGFGMGEIDAGWPDVQPSYHVCGSNKIIPNWDALHKVSSTAGCSYI